MDSEDDFYQEKEEEDDYYSDQSTPAYIYSDDEVGPHDDSVDDPTPTKRTYTLLNVDDIRRRQEEDITNLANVLFISNDWATVLLLHYNWSISYVQDAWFAGEEEVRRKLGFPEKPVAGFVNSKRVTCLICFERYTRRSGVMQPAAGCGHLFCKSCWVGYITTSVRDGPGCLMLRCADPSCSAAVGLDVVKRLVSGEDLEKYLEYFLRSYVENNKNSTLKWCPGPGCSYAVEYSNGSYDVSCNCTHSFCWNCAEDAHRPVDCRTVAKWTAKNADESENVNWILANSKACPKCNRPIQKNDGCMHMTCRPPCKYEFCWLCLAFWVDYGHKCNSFDKKKQEGNEKIKSMAKSLLDRYTHYYERWSANEKSRKKAMEDLGLMQNVYLEKLSVWQCQLVSQLEFIKDAWRQIVECRRVLKWSYAYGYYLPEKEVSKKQFFEYIQGDAENGLERLHQCAEKELKVFLDAEGLSEGFHEFRTKLAGLTSVTKNYFENLVRALENGLSDVDSCDTKT